MYVNMIVFRFLWQFSLQLKMKEDKSINFLFKADGKDDVFAHGAIDRGEHSALVIRSDISLNQIPKTPSNISSAVNSTAADDNNCKFFFVKYYVNMKVFCLSLRSEL